MPYTVKKITPTELEFTISVLPADYQSDLERGAERLVKRANIKGFRPGHVPKEILKKEIGDMPILQEALESIVQHSFYEAVKAEGVETIGMPKVSVTKMAPGNDIAYTATVALMPGVTLPAWDKIAVEEKDTVLPPNAIADVMEELRSMHATERTKEGAAGADDKIVIDMNMTLDKVPVEGGQAKDYGVYLKEDHYVPGFNQELIGLKKGEKKQFTLTFPPSHYQKMLAGKPVDFSITVKDVLTRELPELTDTLAQKLGQASVEKLRELINNNLLAEAAAKAKEQTEIALLEAVIAKTKFEPIPELIIDAEKHKMLAELKRDLAKHNITIDQYLTDIKKTETELQADFQAQAEKRAKAALVSRAIAKQESLTVAPEDMEQELKLIRTAYEDRPDDLPNLDRPEVRDTIATMIQNKKVIEWLRGKLLSK